MPGSVARREVRNATFDICGRVLVIGQWSQSHSHASGLGRRRSQHLPGTMVMQRCHARISFPQRQGSLGGSALDPGISVGRALSRGFESRSTEPPMKTASRRIRVTIPPAVVVARLALQDEPSPRRRRLSVLDRRASERRRSRLISGDRVIGPARARGPRRQLRSCPADGVPDASPRRSSGRGGESYPRIALCDDVAGVASAATRACRAGPPLRSGPSPRSGAPLRRVPPAPACHDLHLAGGE